jgi:phosphoglucosamine mutase
VTAEKKSKQSMFGTDGIRGEYGQGCVTPDGFLRLGYVLGQLFQQKICMGHDGRASGLALQHALTSGLIASGVEVEWLGTVPTPQLSHWTKESDCQAGLMITASHNDALDNGIKIFNGLGEKIAPEQKSHIEQLLESWQHKVSAHQGTYCDRAEDAKKAYIKHIHMAVPSTEWGGKKVVVDCANGGCAPLMQTLCKSIGLEAEIIHSDIDGYNINRDAGSTQPQNLREAVLARNADMGMAFDGDGDRCVLMDSQGRILDGDHLLYLMARSKQEKRIVTTKMANRGLLKQCEAEGIAVVVTDVGDQHVYRAMQTHGIPIGAEPNGHMIITPWSQGGDGPLSALMCIRAVIDSGESLDWWYDSLVKHPQQLLALRFHNPQQCVVIQNQVRAIASAEENVEISMRRSGTEPVLRVLLQAEPGRGQDIRRVAKAIVVLT